MTRAFTTVSFASKPPFRSFFSSLVHTLEMAPINVRVTTDSSALPKYVDVGLVVASHARFGSRMAFIAIRSCQDRRSSSSTLLLVKMGPNKRSSHYRLVRPA